MERPTLLRIKRRLDEDALDVVVLHQSKIRRESTDGPGATDKPDKLFRLMGTLPVALARDKACAEDLLVQVNGARIDDAAAATAAQAEAQAHAHVDGAVDHAARDDTVGHGSARAVGAVARRDPKAVPRTDDERRAFLAEQAKKTSKNARFRLVNSYRFGKGRTAAPDDENDEMARAFDLYDLERSVRDETERRAPRVSAKDALMCNLIPMVRESLSVRDRQQDFVYDVYYLEERADAIDTYESIPVVAFDEDLVLEHEYDDEDDVYGDDDDDSNDENNWRNDYPDEDEWRDGDETDTTATDEYNKSSDDDE